MSLLDLWNSSPEQFENKFVQQIIGFAGDGVLRNHSDASAEFREFLSAVPSDLIAEYTRSCFDKPFTNSGYALQDLINEVGRRLGFEVENGLYQGNRNDVGYDGLWRLPNQHHIVVEVKTTDAFRLDTSTVAEYRRRLISEDRIAEEDSSILYVVGREDTGGLEAQIRGSRYAWDIRLISIESLLKMMFLNETIDDPRNVQRICEILIPKEFTKLDHIVDIVFYAAEDTSDSNDDVQIPATHEDEVVTERRPFTRAESAVRFNESCAERFAKLYGVKLSRRTKTMYEADNKITRIVSLVSRDYEEREAEPNPEKGIFWYGLRDYHRQFISEVEKGFLVLGCGSPDEMLIIPSSEVGPWLTSLNTSIKASGTQHWHIHLYRNDTSYYLEPKQGFERIDVTGFLA